MIVRAETVEEYSRWLEEDCEQAERETDLEVF